MTNKVYKVLWIDDNPTAELRDEANSFGIDLQCKESYSEGKRWLSENITTCDAVILDVYCKDNNDETPNYESFQKNLFDVHSLCTQKSYFIPWFVYTGGPSSGAEHGVKLIDNAIRTIRPKLDGKTFYNKPRDYPELFQKIIEEAGKNETTRIKQKYPSVFRIDDSINSNLLNILSHLESENGCDRDSEILRDVGVVMEKIRGYLVDKGFLPSELVSGIRISPCASFLGRREMQSIIPGYIQQNIYTCVITGSEGGHALPAREDVEKGKAPYLIKSITFAMLSFLHWLSEQEMDKDSIASRTKITMEIYNNSLPDSTPTETQPKVNPLAQKYDGKVFIVEVDEEGFVHCGECATHEKAKSLVGKQVKLSKVNTNTSPSGRKYPVFAARFSEI